MADQATPPRSEVGTTPAGGRAPVNGFRKPSQGLIDRFAAIPTANIADAMERLGALDHRISPAWPGATTVGSAFTVWTRPGDNLGVHRALDQVQPGDVIVVNGGGDTSRALLGELIAGRAKQLGVAGFVVDGAVRDSEGLAEYDMPVFASGRTPAGPYKDGPFATAVTIAVGGVAVNPGDIVAGDADGVVIVPLEHADLVVERAAAKQAAEEAKRNDIERTLGTAETTEGTP